MQASDIITKARFTLSDQDSTRWSDARLISLLNDALLDVALTTRLYNSSGYVELQDNVSIYDVSSFVVKIERVEYLSKPLMLLSFAEMDDRYGTGWQSESSGTPINVIYDLKHSGEFMLHPVPVSDSNTLVTSNSDYGIITGLAYEKAELNIIGDFGDLASPRYENYVKLYYIKTPNEIVDISDELDIVIDRTMLSSLAHYVSGAALRDNVDARNRQVGNEEITFYEDKKQRLADQKTKGNVKRIRITDYRGMG